MLHREIEDRETEQQKTESLKFRDNDEQRSTPWQFGHIAALHDKAAATKRKQSATVQCYSNAQHVFWSVGTVG